MHDDCQTNYLKKRKRTITFNESRGNNRFVVNEKTYYIF